MIFLHNMLPGEKTKVCFKCSAVKPIDMFYSHPQMQDGHLNKCKACTKSDVRQNYADNTAHYKKYERERNQKRKEYNLEKSTTWRLQNKERSNAIKQKWADANSHKRKAQCIVSNYIRDGKLFKKPCVFCGALDKVEAHHTDYLKPLDVIWLCEKHHADIHRLYKQMKDFDLYKNEMWQNTNKRQR